MLDKCGNHGKMFGIKFNAIKSGCLMVGPSMLERPADMIINDTRIIWVNKIKYIGVYLCEGKKFQLTYRIYGVIFLLV